jgi:glycosyltransferase involved in cell wall biosynthesis
MPHLSKEEMQSIHLEECSNWKMLGEHLTRYDVIYSKNEFIEVLALKILGLFYRLPPIIYGIHTAISYESPATLTGKIHNYIYRGYLFRVMLANTYGFHSLNKDTYLYLKQMFPSKRQLLLPNAINSELFRGAESKHNPNIYKILWVGRLTDQKGVFELIQIIKQTNVTVKNRTEWHIVGSGELAYYIDALCREEDNVIFHGWIDNVDLPTIYSEMDLYISTSKWEGMPLTAIEAMFSDLPVISFDIPGMTDIIADNEEVGVMVRSVSEFVDTILKVQAKSIVFKNVRKYALGKYSVGKVYPALVQFLISTSSVVRL